MPEACPSPAATLRVLSGLGEVERAQWDALANPKGLAENPFLSWDFLQALEEAGCAAPRTGWAPRHLVLDGEDGIVGAMPCYLKSHSQGEYVFDYGWADAFERAGGRYYPKLQVSVPFTPVTGRRLLVAPGPEEDKRRMLLAAGLAELTRQTDASSAHLTFLPASEAEALGELGFLVRTDQQFHFVDEGFGNFEGFLSALASRKRKAVRKERREALSAGVDVEWVTGAAITEAHWDAFFEFYMDTGSRKWGRPYLNRRFFSLIGERMAEKILLIMARRNGRYIAGALNLIGSDTLYGRYWGCVEDHPYLHFEICYHQAIEYALAHGLGRVEAGAQGEHKLARGYRPVTTYSAHLIAEPSFRSAVADYLERERQHVELENRVLAEHVPFRKEGG
ncbi:GNAT family N-acetyltransferase [Afifella sp. IM 167]|uniref:GNAT family N-acetyltransferase n=1 Tax=Afifella sp. IM 167 TaxID=2033586 RepID=UPI001CC98716|nr:GNAT family N-acetyltransferase [Afifella sp. IM 167]MBZ8132365.1 GNAT family N-acetyltransferase [Afifella sp. IM 167]